MSLLLLLASPTSTELVTNGTFDSNTTGWTAEGAGVISWDALGRLKLDTSSSGVAARASQTIAITTGVTYRLVGTIWSSPAGYGRIATNQAGTIDYNGGPGPTTMGYNFTATGASLTIYLDNASDSAWANVGTYTLFDNISLQRLSTTPANAVSAHTSSEPTLTAKSVVAPANATSAHTSSEPTLAAKSVVAPANATSTHTSSEPALATTPLVNPNASTSAHTSSSPTLAAKSVVAPASATSAHTSSSPTLAAKSALTPANSNHAHTSSSPTIAWVIAPTNATSAHTSSSPTLAAKSALTPANSNHAHTSSSPTIAWVIAPANATSAHTSSSPTLAAKSALTPANSNHAHTSSEPTVVIGAVTVYPHNMIHGGAGTGTGGPKVTAFFYRR